MTPGITSRIRRNEHRLFRRGTHHEPSRRPSGPSGIDGKLDGDPLLLVLSLLGLFLTLHFLTQASRIFLKKERVDANTASSTANSTAVQIVLHVVLHRGRARLLSSSAIIVPPVQAVTVLPVPLTAFV